MVASLKLDGLNNNYSTVDLSKVLNLKEESSVTEPKKEYSVANTTGTDLVTTVANQAVDENNDIVLAIDDDNIAEAKKISEPNNSDGEKDEIARKVDTDEVSKAQAEYIENYIKDAIGANGIKITDNKKDGKTQTITAENSDGDTVKVTVKYDDDGRPISINVVTTKQEGDTKTETEKGIDIEYDGDDMITKDKNPKYTAETEQKIKDLMDMLDCTRKEAIKILKEKDQLETDDDATKVKEDGTIYKKNEDGEWEKTPTINLNDAPFLRTLLGKTEIYL